MRDHVTARDRTAPLRWRALRMFLRDLARYTNSPLPLGVPRLVRETDGIDYIRFRGWHFAEPHGLRRALNFIRRHTCP